jgi:RNA polymerase sigma-70 factor, ECF subfamily
LDNPETSWVTSVIVEASQGNQNAYAELVNRFQTPVFNLCYRMLGDQADAEDAAQETFWRAFQSLNRYDRHRPFITWLLSISAHYCIDQLRKRHLTTLPMDILRDEEAPDPNPNPEIVASRSEETRSLQIYLSKLGPQDRAAIILRYWYDLSEDEIGRTLALTPSAVKSRLHRARLELAQLWQSDQSRDIPFARRTDESPAI